MQLLVSVRNAAEAAAALAGGADIIDAKEPSRGALGPVTCEALQQIRSAVGSLHPVTAALGDATTAGAIEQDAFTFMSAGARLVKIGLAGIDGHHRAEQLIAAAVRGARRAGVHAGVVAVAYADAERVGSLSPFTVSQLAARAGAAGVLIDTAVKSGPGLLGVLDRTVLAAWVAGVRDAGLIAAMAGQLTAGDLAIIRAVGADIAGVRGAACDAGRNGRISEARVRFLRAKMDAVARD
jgi:uncharacterized protein (UPF0264 family)